MRHRLLAVAMLSTLALPTFGADTPDGSRALHCGKLFDSRSGKLLGPHVVVVRDGRIVSVGRAGEVQVPVGARARRFLRPTNLLDLRSAR